MCVIFEPILLLPNYSLSTLVSDHSFDFLSSRFDSIIVCDMRTLCYLFCCYKVEIVLLKSPVKFIALFSDKVTNAKTVVKAVQQSSEPRSKSTTKVGIDDTTGDAIMFNCSSHKKQKARIKNQITRTKLSQNQKSKNSERNCCRRLYNCNCISVRMTELRGVSSIFC